MPLPAPAPVPGSGARSAAARARVTATARAGALPSGPWSRASVPAPGSGAVPAAHVGFRWTAGLGCRAGRVAGLPAGAAPGAGLIAGAGPGRRAAALPWAGAGSGADRVALGLEPGLFRRPVPARPADPVPPLRAVAAARAFRRPGAGRRRGAAARRDHFDDVVLERDVALSLAAGPPDNDLETGAFPLGCARRACSRNSARVMARAS